MNGRTEPGISDYWQLKFSERRELDQKAYSNYYNDYFDVDDNVGVLSFNSWYGTEYHKKYVNVLLRKHKLKKIENIK